MESRHGTVVEARDGLPVRVVDRTGVVQAELEWDGRRLVSLATGGARVRGEVIADALLGDAHVIEADGHPAAVLTTMSALDWVRPTEIPTIAAPARVPLGAGSAILNVIAMLAARAEVPALRYAGPYPSPALWRTLARSFRTTADEAAFTAGMLDRAVRVARDPLPIDFAPAPFERISLAAAGWVEVRDAPERVVLDGVTYEPTGSPARLIALADGWSAELWFGDGPWAHVARLGVDGALVDGPHAIPALTSTVLGREFPPNLRAELAELVADCVPPLLAHDARVLVAARRIAWADLGARAARITPDGLEVHAALWERIAPLGLPRLALALAEALAPVVTTALLADVIARVARP